MAKTRDKRVDERQLLQDVADALNACERAGMTVRLKHNSVVTRAGYVFGLDTGWEPRTLLYTEFTPPAVSDDDGID